MGSSEGLVDPCREAFVSHVVLLIFCSTFIWTVSTEYS